MLWAARVARTLLALTCVSLVHSEVQKVDLVPDRGATVSFSSSPSTGFGCKVCTRVKNTRQCAAQKTFNTGPVSVELECTNQQGPFSVEVSQTVECTTKSCNGIIQTSKSYDALLSLTRNFVWNVKPASPKAARIDFGRAGVKPTSPSEKCPGSIFKFEVLQEAGTLVIGRYCSQSPITDLQVQEPRTVSLEVQAGQKLQDINFQVSFGEDSKSKSKMPCVVDLKKLPDVSLHLKKLSPRCIMKQKSVSKEQTTLSPGSVTQLSFENCLPHDVQVTASKKMGCSQARTCPRLSLSIPSLPACLPAPLSNMTWALSLPPHGTVELGCTSGTLSQELPGQPCNDSISIKMTEDDGSTIGTFCRTGSITKLQIHNNITITVSGTKGNVLGPSNILTARIKEEISEKYIFRVSPKKNAPLLLATPGWPKGMLSDGTVSWIVTVPPKMEALVKFTDLKQPKCSTRHTNIRIQRLGRLEEDYSRREDEKHEDQVTVSQSFFLNMSNCVPERGDFSVLTTVTLKKSQLMTVIVAIVAALLVIFTAVLVVVCLVIRKKKKKLNHHVSVYNGNGTSFLPGQNGGPKSQEDDEHVYAEIEDTLVYSDLLRKGAQMGTYKEYDHKPQPGHSDSEAPLQARESAEGDTELGENQELPQQQRPALPQRPDSAAQPMVDNALYETRGPGGERSPSLGPRLDPDGGELTP